MSLRYRNNNGEESHIAGMNGTSGELVPSVALQQSGTVSIPSQEAHSQSSAISVTFTTPMPDTDYEVIFGTSDTAGHFYRIFTVNSKTVNGFTFLSFNADVGTANAGTIEWTAFKLMTDEATALATEQITQNTLNFAPAFSESTAYSVGQYVTYVGKVYKCTTAHSAGAWDASHFTAATVGGTLGEIVPSDASASNKLATEDSSLQVIQLSGTVDCDTLTEPGLYVASAGAVSALTNAPVEDQVQLNGGFSILVTKTSAESVFFGMQMFTPYGSDLPFIRKSYYLEGQYWTSWSRINVVDSLADDSLVNLSDEFVKADNVIELDVYAQRKHGFVTLWVEANININESSMSTMSLTSSGTLPEKYRPARDVSQSISGYQGNTNNGYVDGRLSVSNSGSINLGERYLVGAATSGNWIFKWTITYVV